MCAAQADGSGLDHLAGYLRHEGVPFALHQHPAYYTTQELARIEHVAGGRMAKVVMVFADDHPAMLVLPAPAQVSVEAAAAALGRRRVRLAHEEEFTPLFPDCDAGAMPPFGNLYGVPVYVDAGLAREEVIVFQAGTHRHTMELAFADFVRLARPRIVEIAAGAGREGVA